MEDVLDNYTSKGFRVIALAQKPLGPELFVELEDISREDVEKELKLLGLLVLQNRLKPESAPAVRCLGSASIRSVMVTGKGCIGMKEVKIKDSSAQQTLVKLSCVYYTVTLHN